VKLIVTNDPELANQIMALRVLVWVSFSLRHRSDPGNYAANALSFA
jgi:hypothetical protein